MTEKLICPECGSDHVRFLVISKFNPYMYGCGECWERWGDARIRELPTDMKEVEATKNDETRYKIQIQVHPDMAFYDYIDATENDLSFSVAEEKLGYLKEYLSNGGEYRTVERGNV